MIIWVVPNIKKYKIPNMNRHIREKIRTPYQNNGGFILKFVRITYQHTQTHTHTIDETLMYVNFNSSQELPVYILGMTVINDILLKIKNCYASVLYLNHSHLNN